MFICRRGCRDDPGVAIGQSCPRSASCTGSRPGTRRRRVRRGGQDFTIGTASRMAIYSERDWQGSCVQAQASTTCADMPGLPRCANRARSTRCSEGRTVTGKTRTIPPATPCATCFGGAGRSFYRSGSRAARIRSDRNLFAGERSRLSEMVMPHHVRFCGRFSEHAFAGPTDQRRAQQGGSRRPASLRANR